MLVHVILEAGAVLVHGGYLARPHLRLGQRVNGGDVGAIESASPGADSIAFVLHSWGRKTTLSLGLFCSLCVTK